MNPIKTAICSFGMSGRLFHAPFIDVHEGFQLSAVWERSRREAEKFYPGIRSFSSYEEMLAMPGLELVVVNTPNYTHYEYARMALEAGKHVLVEKPFTIQYSEAESLLELAAKRGLIISVYQNRRFDSDFQLVKQVMQQGLLGELAEAEIHFDRFNLALSAKKHKEIPGPGTGVLFDLGPHLIDQALQLFGRPDHVFADVFAMRKVSQVPDYMEVLLYYPRLRVRLKSGYLVMEPIPSYVLHGSNGSFHKSRADVQEADLLNGKKPGSAGWGNEATGEEGLLVRLKEGIKQRELLPAPAGNYLEFYEQLYLAIRDAAAAPVTAEEALATMRVLELAGQSAAQGKMMAY
ncbi:MAG TPA: Gfo/Idh/MocA family oxidoreductase [Chitinophagaceae bacterium]|nr:Gfo/Idh/MocA family oxidoreductase [Chitinophagaceae bacterium]